MEMNYSATPWAAWQACPCDLDFIEYLRDNHIKDKLIFHFGTGSHHLVAKANYECGDPNEILGITICKKEYDAYVDFVVSNPAAANFYKVLFADIYTLSSRMLPSFDLVTLFHLGEYYDIPPNYYKTGDATDDDSRRVNSAYARLNDVTLLELFLNKLSPGGKIVFYRGSDGFKEPRCAGKIFADFISGRRMVLVEEYKSLRICARPE